MRKNSKIDYFSYVDYYSLKLSYDIWPYLLYLVVFSTGRNETDSGEDADFSKCGVNYCPAVTSNDDVPKPENKTETDNFTITIQQRYILAGVYLICSVLSAIIVSLFVDPLSR